MSIEHPFQSLFESFAHPPAAHAKSVNRLAYQALCEVLTVPLEHRGRCLLLRAPRAGYGKTHLLSHIRQHFGPSHEFLPLQAAAGTRVDAATVTDDTLRWLTRLVPAAGALCGLDWVVRRLFSLALQPLVRSGEVPCLDREGTLASLCDRPLETFDFHHPSALSAHWTRDNFGVLGPRLSLELAQLTGCPPRAVSFWVDAMFRFAVTPTDQTGRVDTLFQTAAGDCCGEGAGLERLSTLLSLIGLLARVVLVADDLEGFSGDPAAALRTAWFLGALRHSADRLDVILSVNRDVWDSAFVPRLSGGLAERLAEVIVELEPLSDADQVALLESRAPGMGARMLRSIGPDPIERHARGLLREAGAAWLKVAREASPTTQSEPSATPPPLAAVTPATAHEPAANVAPPPVTSGTAPVAAGLQPPRLTEPPPLVGPPEPPPLRLMVQPPVQPPVQPSAQPVASPLAHPLAHPPAHPPSYPQVHLSVQQPVQPPEPPPIIRQAEPIVRPAQPPPARLTEPSPPLSAEPPPAVQPPEPPPIIRQAEPIVHRTEPPPLGLPETPPVFPPHAPAHSLSPAFAQSTTEQPTLARPTPSTPPLTDGASALASPAAPVQPATPVALPATPEASDADAIDIERVDSLLRQFRQRYGRPDPE